MPEMKISNLNKAYGSITALKEVSLEVRDGEYVSIVGPSGCGKTTLIKSIAGIVEPDSGEVEIGGKLMDALPVEDRGVGYVFQEIALFPHMAVRDNVSYGLFVKGVPPEERSLQVREMLNMMALNDRASSYPSELSGGARQKTAIARALASGSSLLLLDEPLGALDLKVRTVLRYELRRLVKDLGLTAIHITHDQEEALSVSDRVAVMKAGRLIEIGAPTELYMRPNRLFTMKFLGESNFMVGKLVEESDDGFVVDVEGIRLKAGMKENLGLQAGDPVVLGIRPEFIHLERKGRPRGVNILEGRVMKSVFAGEVARYEVEIANGRVLLVKHYVSRDDAEFKSGEKVFLEMPRKHLMPFRYPEGGLEGELSLE